MDDLYDRLAFLADEAEGSPEGRAHDRQDQRPAIVLEQHEVHRTRAERARDVTATSAARLNLMV